MYDIIDLLMKNESLKSWIIGLFNDKYSYYFEIKKENLPILYLYIYPSNLYRTFTSNDTFEYIGYVYDENVILNIIKIITVSLDKIHLKNIN